MAIRFRLSRSIVGEAEAEAVHSVLVDEGYLGMGRDVQLFEQELAAFLGVPADSVVCVNSGTAALHLAIEACVPKGAEVLVPSLTFVATFQAISAAGCIPVPCEVTETTLTLDNDDAQARITDKTRAIMPVHYASNPGDLEATYRLAERRGLRVIEDAAHSFGCAHNGVKVGARGDIACFSFDGIKNITSGEGGAIVTSDRSVLERMRDARLLGVAKDTQMRYSGQRSWEFDVQHQGYRYHMSNIMAAIGRVQLRRFAPEFAPARVRLAQRYRRRLAGVPQVRFLETELGPIVPHIQPILVGGSRRDALREHLENHGVQTGIHYKPNHLLSLYGGGAERLPRTVRLYGELLTLPLHPGLMDEDVEEICGLICKFFENQS